MDYCQHFTADHCSDALIAEVGHVAPHAVLDVGAGWGSLSRAALKRWEGIDLHVLDVDRKALIHLQTQFPQAKHVKANLLSPSISSELSSWAAQADLVLCNPPFTTSNNTKAEFWLYMAGMPAAWPTHLKQRAEIIFLAHNLLWLKPQGELLMILPACFINGQNYLQFRRWLLERMTVLKVARLPRNAFRSAEVKAFAVIARNSPSAQNDPVELIDLAARDGSQPRTTISRAQAMQRMDFDFHVQSQILAPMCLGDLQAQIVRGVAVSTLRHWGVDFFHTTDFVNSSALRNICLPKAQSVVHSQVLQAGDLVLGRVGRNCHQQVAQVLRGQSHFSDCVYRLRLPLEWRQAVFKSLRSQAGQVWRAARLRGSAVALLSKADLLQHPIWWGEAL